ncbi:MAG: DEAD/DEAH box helicase [Verrucomicrobiales bacterium]|nr:DEAD/DEAH box helicase [Verrucomicrobiales bacterium]
MNPVVRHFLPSVVRGVYRFDVEFASVTNDEELQRFTSRKLRFLPLSFSAELVRRVRLAPDLPRNEQQLVLPRGMLDGTKAVARRAQRFFEQHRHYFANALDDATGEASGHNFLEIEFVKRILAPLLNPRGLLAVCPQREVGPYLIDFALEGQDTKLALEVDGFEKFSSRDDLDSFVERQNHITSQGWRVFRYTYSQILEAPAATLREVHDLLKQDPRLRGFLNIRWEPGGLVDPDDRDTAWNAVELVNAFYRVQDHFAEVAIRDDRPTFVVKDGLGLGFPFVAAAISALFEFLQGVEALMDVRLGMPTVRVTGPQLPADWEVPFHPAVSLSPAEQGDARLIDGPTTRGTRSHLPAPPAMAGAVSFRKGLSVSDAQERCQQFCNSVFGYPKTRPFQDRVLQRVFDGQPVVGISATGSGKSFCFWLPALLKPGLTLVVCPLRSLMRDQIMALRSYGIASAEFINRDVSAAAQRRIFNEVRLGYVRLLYVAPERMRLRSFMDQLKRLQQDVPVNFLVIDEAHCISEWGHDFRPAYLVLPSLYDALARANPRLGLIALTATAGQLVEQDILHVLKLRGGPDGSVVRDPRVDRLRFSYQILPVEAGMTKSELFRRVLNEHLPKALRQPSLDRLLQLRHGDGDKSVGIVFCIYADPHGQHSTQDGVAHYLFESKQVLEPHPGGAQLEFAKEAFSTGRVRGFCSKTPTLCPNCSSYDYSRMVIDLAEEEEVPVEDEQADQDEEPPGERHCAWCGLVFGRENVVKPDQWDKVLEANQIAFKESRLDILVATKVFGMGIDKGSVRFVVHTALSSGLESWYQEVGRAGRDEQRAHIVLLFDPPTASCHEELNSGTSRRPRCTTHYNCPHGRESLCDYGKQHMFIRSSYPGVESDAVAALHVLLKLLAARTHRQSPQLEIPSHHQWLSRHELAVYRLKALGLIDGYHVDYTHGHHPRFVITPNSVLSHDVLARIAELESRMVEGVGQHFSYCATRSDRPVAEQLTAVDERYSNLERLNSRAANRLRNNVYFRRAVEAFRLVYRYLLVLLDHAYEEVWKMRYDMLWNLYTLATARQCRRTIYLPGLRGERVEPGYRCGCCDVCCPGLEFRAERIPPQLTTVPEEQEAELRELYATGRFDLPALSRLREVFADYPTHQYHEALGVLEGSPQNLPALFFAQVFSPAEYYEGNAKRLLEAANRRPLPLGDVKALYGSTRREHRPRLLLTLNETHTACACVEGWRFLAEEARNVEHEPIPEMRLLREYLEFMLLVQVDLPQITDSMRHKVAELKEAMHA